jgi:PAS domain S-box-containing protein
MIATKLQRCSFVLAVCIGAATLSWMINAPSSCFHLAIVICCLYGGETAGLVASGLAILSFDYFFLAPHFSFFVERSAYPRFAAFIATAVCINLVIAAKQRGERARRKVEEQYRVISETALDGVLSTDNDGRVLLVNSSATAIFGHAAMEMIGQPITRFVPQSCNEVSSSVVEMTVVRKDGSPFVAEVCFGKVAANNKCAGVIFVRDITERKRSENALQKMEVQLARASQIATLAEVSASIAHEINQPLTAIIANAHMCCDSLASECVRAADARLLVQEILESGYHATEVVHRMRTLFKGGTFERTKLDINDVAKEVINLMRAEAAKRRVDLEVDLETELPKILGDRVQIQQVFVNLCINGFDAMDTQVDRSRKLSVRTRVHDSAAIRVEVQDSGIGLREPERIFEAFFTTKQNGMGMGLPICRSIIELHNGRLWPENGNVSGTTFCFTLPIPDPESAEPQHSNGRHRPNSYVSVG